VSHLFSQDEFGLGAKVKVKYGERKSQEKSYFAKIIEIDYENGQPMYLVHYQGWNVR
jgi:hypothetical protein